MLENKKIVRANFLTEKHNFRFAIIGYLNLGCSCLATDQVNPGMV